MTSELLRRALIEEATKKSGLIWVQGAAPATGAGGLGAPARALWHVWHEGAACVLGDGPGEQPLPGLADGGEAIVTVRSKDKGGRLVTWPAKVVQVTPGSAGWDGTVAELKGKRLNTPDGEAAVERWSRECRVLRLVPQGGTVALPDGSLASPPPATPATTRRPIPAALPRLLRRKRR